MLSDGLKRELLEFRAKRAWEQFHTPKNLAISIVLEAAELLENFQWKTDDEIKALLKGKKFGEISEEIADIVVYLSYLSSDLGIDLEKAIAKKLEKNRKKYPAEKVKGSAKKYNEY
jgi:NTP pyrophosphatase (non-canonical NTP hydrolase)